MEKKFQFTFESLKNHFQAVLRNGYRVLTCEEYCRAGEFSDGTKVLVNRIDIDLSVKKAERLGLLFNDLGIKGSFFVRLHASEYNPFSFENYRILKFLAESGHELGYHSEIVDQASIWGEDSAECLKRDIDVMNRMFGIKIEGVASHGGMTGLNNLDFWKDRKASEFGLLYEAYEKSPTFNLFNNGFYISDSEWTRWKCYDKGILVNGDRRDLSEHVLDGHPLIYLLIHSDTYYDRHFYE